MKIISWLETHQGGTILVIFEAFYMRSVVISEQVNVLREKPMNVSSLLLIVLFQIFAVFVTFLLMFHDVMSGCSQTHLV
jgi:hypothetical protein